MSPAASESLSELLTEHLTWLEARRYATSTIDARRRQLARFVDWLEDRGVTEPCQVTLPVLERYRLALHRHRKRDGSPLGWGSQAQMLVAVKGLFKWLTLTKRTRTNPAAEIELPRRAYRLPRSVLTSEEAELILAVPDTTKAVGVRDRTILEVLYSTGVRRAECASLQLTDLELGRGVLLVREGKGGRDRFVPLGDRAADWVERWLVLRPRYVVPPDDGWLFLTKRGRPLAPKRLGGLASRYIEASGIGKTGSCHLFRHTMATLMLEAGADVRYIQEILGHAELSTTALYTRVSIGKLQDVHRRTHPARARRTDRDHEKLLSGGSRPRTHRPDRVEGGRLAVTTTVTVSMEAKAKERLYRLVDRIPDGEVHTAERFLEYLARSDDPVMRALLNAPEDDEPLTDEDREALEEGRRALAEGEVVSDEELRAELGI